MNTNFNSIKVRLKRKYKAIVRYFAEFQFHKGTIKTLNETQGALNKAYFNSIKVRLKQDGVSF